MVLVIFLVILVASQCIAYRDNCDNDDYYQDRHRGIRRYYQRAEISPEELYLHPDSLGDDSLDDEVNLINHETDESGELPFVMLPKSSRLNKAKYAKLLARYLPKNLQNFGYKILGKKSGKYGNLILLSPKTANHYINKDDGVITVNGNEINRPEVLSDADEYNSLNLGGSNNVEELAAKRKLYGSSVYGHANSNMQEVNRATGINSGVLATRRRNSYGGHLRQKNRSTNTNQNSNINIDREDLGDFDSAFKARRTLSGSRSQWTDTDISEDIIEADNSNNGATIIVSARSGNDIESDNENENINTNANINNEESGSGTLLAARRNSLNAEAEYGETTDMVSNNNELSRKSGNGPTIIVSTRRKQTEAIKGNHNVNVNAENSGGSPTIIVGARRNIQNGERQHESRNNVSNAKRNRGGPIVAISARKQLNAAANTNKNVNLNTDVNTDGEGNPTAVIPARRNSLKTEASYGSRSNAGDNELAGARRNNNNNNINVNTNVNSEDGESSPETVTAGRRNAFKADASYGSRRNVGDNESVSAKRNDNNINVNTNVNTDDGSNPTVIIAARRNALKTEAGYGGRSHTGQNSDGDLTDILSAKGELNPTEILDRRNSNENSNVNVNVNAEDVGSSPSIIGAARRRLSALNGNERNLQGSLGLQRQNIIRRSQHHAPKNENRNVNINVNRLESDEV